MKNLRVVSYWAPPALWAAGIFVLSSISLPPKPPVFPLQDKVAHLLLFVVLAFLLLRAFRRERGMSPPRAAAWAFLVTSLYGAFDEFHQSFIPTRSSDVFDWLTDTLAGATTFLTVLAPPKDRAAKGHNKGNGKQATDGTRP